MQNLYNCSLLKFFNTYFKYTYHESFVLLHWGLAFMEVFKQMGAFDLSALKTVGLQAFHETTLLLLAPTQHLMGVNTSRQVRERRAKERWKRHCYVWNSRKKSSETTFRLQNYVNKWHLIVWALLAGFDSFVLNVVRVNFNKWMCVCSVYPWKTNYLLNSFENRIWSKIFWSKTIVWHWQQSVLSDS